MVNSRLETVVRRLFSDEEFRAMAIEKPETALEEYGLSEVERRSLGRLCKSLVPVDGASPARGQTSLSWE